MQAIQRPPFFVCLCLHFPSHQQQMSCGDGQDHSLKSNHSEELVEQEFELVTSGLQGKRPFHYTMDAPRPLLGVSKSGLQDHVETVQKVDL